MRIKEKVLFAGFGGQGILAAGKIFAEAGVETGLKASWLPSYGPEMRGGTCNCQVVVSDEDILSPIFTRPTSAIIMNQASLDRFINKMGETKYIVVNTSLVEMTDESRKALKSVNVVRVDATNIALGLGSVKAANMVALGAYAKYNTAIDFDTMKKSIEMKFKSKPKEMDLNLKALTHGHDLA